MLTKRRDVEAYVGSLRRHRERQGAHGADFDKPYWWDALLKHDPRTWDYDASAREYDEHIAAVRAHFAGRPGKLLEVCWERGDGWEALAPFLGHGVPAEAFPHLNRSPAAPSA